MNNYVIGEPVKLKILIVTQYFWPESFKVNDLALELKNRGHEVTVYTGLPNYPQGKFHSGYSISGPYKEDYQGVKVIRSPLFPRGKGLGFRLLINYFSFLLFATILAPFKIRGSYDKIFIYQLSPVFAAIPAVFLRFLKKAPSILWVTDLWPDSLDATGVVKNKYLLSFVGMFVKLIYKFSDQIYISSRGFEPKIVSMGVPSKKIKFWPQWAENFFDNYDSSKDTYHDSKFPTEGFIITFAGNIGSAQDMPTIIEAAELLRDHTQIHFVILGDGVMREWTETEVAKRNLSKNVHILGRKPIETMPYYYSKSSALLVSLTKRELFSITLPSKVQTYLASGKPIMVSLDGEGAELVLKYKAGLAAPAESPVILAEKILEFSKLTPAELAQMGKNAYDCYQSQFEREKLISILEADLNSLKY
jgi:glycosyltransferase involved in cell wall biosynthesis